MSELEISRVYNKDKDEYVWTWESLHVWYRARFRPNDPSQRRDGGTCKSIIVSIYGLPMLTEDDYPFRPISIGTKYLDIESGEADDADAAVRAYFTEIHERALEYHNPDCPHPECG